MQESIYLDYESEVDDDILHIFRKGEVRMRTCPVNVDYDLYVLTLVVN